MYENNDEIEIDLRELFFVLKKHVLIVILTAVVFAGGAGVITKFAMTPIYSSTAQLYVFSKNTSLANLTDLELGTKLTQDYMVLVTTRPVLNQVIKDLKLSYTYEDMVGKVTAQNPTDTRILQLTVSDPDPELAQKMTQDLAKVTSTMVAKKMAMDAPTILEDSYLPKNPDSPNTKKNVLAGGILGLCLAAFIILLIHLMNDTVRTEDDIEKYLGLNTLTSIPLNKEEAKERKHKGRHKRKGAKKTK
ncbi:MAG: Wzz/FepE/Etk N-terminal domain-containing protein [Anaerostipes sp.]|jgi:capsular polysaccharide biosynthesis protein|nr:Wzz/FepE/Etk N-terminal domain-containing protein [Anaerostipes sp.]MDD3745789.1 Wzz/FepE/Etk N-terminal domain-containing protein [Anaerostipes sp.]